MFLSRVAESAAALTATATQFCVAVFCLKILKNVVLLICISLLGCGDGRNAAPNLEKGGRNDHCKNPVRTP